MYTIVDQGRDLLVSIAAKIDDGSFRRAGEQAANTVQRAFSNRNPLGTYTTDFKHFRDAIDAATSRVTAFGLTAGVFFTVKVGLLGLVKSTIEVEKGLTNINVVLGLSARNLKVFSEDLFKVATQAGQTFDIASKAATEFSRQGLGVAETLKRTRDALILSRMAGLDAMTAVADLTAAMNSFSDSILDSTQLISKFIAVDQRFAVSSADIAEAIKRVGSTAQDAGIDVDQLIGMITSLQETTARGGAVIGQSLKTIFTRLTNPETVNVLEEFNIKIKDLNNNLLPTAQILGNIVEKFNQLGQSEKIKIESKIGNLYQINQLKALLRDLNSGSSSTARDAADISRGAGSEALIRNEQMNQTISAQINRTSQNLKLTFSKLGEEMLGPNLKMLLGGGNSLLEGLNDSKGVEGIGSMMGKSILKGLGDAILVGAGYVVVTLGKIFFYQLGKIAQAFKSVLDFGSFTKQTAIETNTALQGQASTTEKLVSVASQRLAVERETLGVIQAQNAATGKAGGISSLATRSMFPGSGSGFTGLNSNTSTLNPPIPSLAGTQGRASIMGKIGAVSRKLSDSSKLLLDPNVQNDPQMLRVINEERKISQTELGSLRNQLAVIDASQRQRNESLKDINRVKNNYIASRFTTQREQSYAREAAGRAAGSSITRGLSALDEGSGFGPGIASIDALRARRQSGEMLDKSGRPIPSALFQSASGFFRKQSAVEALEKLDPKSAKQAAEIRASRMMNASMLTSFMAPMAGNLMADSFFPGTSGSDRVGSAVTRGVGNAASGAAMGFTLSGGNPIGAAIGGLITGLTSLLGIFKEMRDILPEVNARMDKVKNDITRGEESISTLNRLGERAEGLVSGRIANTPANLSNYKTNAKTFLSSQVGNLSATQIDEMAKDINSGDPEKLKKWGPLLLNPSLQKTQSVNQLIGASQAFNNGSLDSQGLMSILGGTVGAAGVSGASTSVGKSLLGSVKLPTEYTDQGWTTRAKGDYTGLLSFIQSKTGMSQEEYQNLNTAFQSNSKLAETYLDFFNKSAGVAFQPTENFNPAAVPKTPNPNLDLQKALEMSAFSSRTTGTFGHIGNVRAGQEANLSVLQATNQARIARGELTMNPIELAGLSGRLGKEEIFGATTLKLGDLQSTAGSGLLKGIGGLQGSLLGNSERTKKYGGQLSGLEFAASNLAAGVGSPEEIKALIEKFKNSMVGDESATTEFTGTLGELNGIADGLIYSQMQLKIGMDAQVKTLDISTKLTEELAAPQAAASKALNDLTWSLKIDEAVFRTVHDSGKDLEQAMQRMRHSIETSESFISDVNYREMLGKEATSGYTTGLETERAKFEAMKNAGYLYSDQSATGNLSQRVGDISTGKLGGAGLAGATIGSFSDSMKFGIKDMYRDLVQGAAEVGSALKSSFKDAFVTFLDGSKSATDALRGLGLSFASKLLDIAAQGTTNMLFGSLQSLGSSTYNAIAKGATGGYVTGGSGIRDDVPAMLAEGDFVLRQSAVSKYGVGNLSRLNFASGGANITPTSPLSNFALSDENNPQNQLRMEKEANDLNALLQYTAAKQAFDSAKKQRRLGALISLGIGLGAAGISYGASKFGQPAFQTGAMSRLPASTSSINTSVNVGRMGMANGGSVDNVPALLMGGEFVMNRNAVSRVGVGFMHRLNRGEVPAFADGGFVGETIPNGSGRGNSDSGLNDSISRLINSNEKLRTSMEKGGSTQDQTASQGNTQPIVGSISINVYSDSNGNTKADTKVDGGTNESKNNTEKGAQLGQLIQATVLDVINKQSRNGGILEQNFQRKR